MAERSHSPVQLRVSVELKAAPPGLKLSSLVVGIDNVHHDVFLSPKWVEQTRAYLLNFTRQIAKLTYLVEKTGRPSKGAETTAWKRQLLWAPGPACTR